jgi:hypothetical protein
MEKEVEDHEGRGHWILVPRSTIPSGNKPIKAIWSFMRKRFPDGCLNKHKARLCTHGGMQCWGENYWETYSPVVNMISVKLLLVIAKIHGLELELKSVDFVLAFPQADLDIDIWMELPIGFQTIKDPYHSQLYVLKLKKNLYGLKQASFNWYEKLRDGLKDRGFKPSKINQCLYMKDGMVILVYVNDCIIVGKDMGEINEFVRSMQQGSENFVLTDEGSVDKFLGIEIKRLGKQEFEISQPFLIDRILVLLQLEHNGFETDSYDKLTPAAPQILNKEGWDQTDRHNANNLMSRSGFVIKYADCPIYWSSKLQTEIALSTAEAEYIALSSSLREVIPLMTVMDELNKVFPLLMEMPKFYCKVWEDNQSCIAMATSQKFTPRTKHIALKYHHFKGYIELGQIQINYIHTERQQAVILTKPVRTDLFPKLRYMLMGW